MKLVSEKMAVVMPIHPRTKNKIKEFGFSYLIENFITLEPLSYMDTMSLVKHSFKVVTDSGGLQKEAFFAGKEAVVLMEDTSWRELVDLKFNYLLDPLSNNFKDVIFTKNNVNRKINIYGEGSAAPKIVQQILRLESGM
jgi:UDP-N-acetylglucosamine 2-epimerase (non-hydrolysing)